MLGFVFVIIFDLTANAAETAESILPKPVHTTQPATTKKVVSHFVFKFELRLLS